MRRQRMLAGTARAPPAYGGEDIVRRIMSEVAPSPPAYGGEATVSATEDDDGPSAMVMTGLGARGLM